MTKDICSKIKGDIKDKFERRINYLRVSVTDRCNLRCFYCMPEGGVSQLDCKDILRYEEILRIIRISAQNGIDKVRITGGEPLIRKGIVDFIKDAAKIKSNEPPIASINDLSLTTNGVLLGKMAKDLFNAGLTRINISIDSLKENTFCKITRYDYLKKVIRGLKKAHEVGFKPIKINVVIIRGLNDTEIIDFTKLSIENPFSVRFIEFMPIGGRNNWDENLFVNANEIKKKIDAFSRLEKVEKIDESSPSSDYKFKGAKGTIGFISPLSKHFCLYCNRLRLTADGKLRNCLFSDKEIDLKDAIRSGKSDEEISAIIREAILKKPEGHEKLNEDSKKKRAMHSIGG